MIFDRQLDHLSSFKLLTYFALSHFANRRSYSFWKDLEWLVAWRAFTRTGGDWTLAVCCRNVRSTTTITFCLPGHLPLLMMRRRTLCSWMNKLTLCNLIWTPHLHPARKIWTPHLLPARKTYLMNLTMPHRVTLNLIMLHLCVNLTNGSTTSKADIIDLSTNSARPNSHPQDGAVVAHVGKWSTHEFLMQKWIDLSYLTTRKLEETQFSCYSIKPASEVESVTCLVLNLISFLLYPRQVACLR